MVDYGLHLEIEFLYLLVMLFSLFLFTFAGFCLLPENVAFGPYFCIPEKTVVVYVSTFGMSHKGQPGCHIT